MTNATLYLPSTEGLEVGQTVRVHSAGQDRNASVVAIKGEKALVWYVLKNGETRERWVRSQATVTAKDATTSQKTNAAKAIRNYTRYVLTARVVHDERALALAEALKDNGAAALVEADRRRAGSGIYAGNRPYTWRPRADERDGASHLLAEVLSMLALGTGNVEEGPGGLLKYDETGATRVASLEDSLANAAAHLEEMNDRYAAALVEARQAGSTEAQIGKASLKGRLDAEAELARAAAYKASR